MLEGTASKTAQGQAILRTVESLAPDSRRVCNDPLAVEFLEEKLRRRYKRVRNSRFWTQVWLRWLYFDPSGSNAEAIARTRYIDDYLQAGIKSGVDQVVILGAGCDSRAYRIKGLEGIRVFEVDHPDTQENKIANVRRLPCQLPPWVTYVPVEFERQKLGERLLSSGYRSDTKTLFIWEGVTTYLTAEAIDSTLSFVVAHSGRGSSIIFNYWYKSAVSGESTWKWAKVIRKNAEKVGEPIIFGIDGEDIEEFLLSRGFSAVKRVTPSLLNGLYFRGPNASRRVCPFVEIACATVGPAE